MQFNYKALRKDNSPISGTIEAADHDAALEALAHQGLHPLIVSEVPRRIGSGFGKRIKSSDLVIFTRQLSTMISAGVPIARGLATLKDSSTNGYFRQVLGRITKDIEGGTQLGNAFAKYPNIFDDVYVNMVRAGEEGGILDDILKRLAVQVEQNASIKKKVKSAMTYPIVILVITVIAFFGIMFVLMPKISKILTELGGPDAKLPVYTQALLNLSDFSRRYALIIIPGMILTVWAIRRYIKTPKGKYQFHALLLRTPIVKTIVMKVAIARFSRTFASLMSAGVGVLDALSITGGAIGNKVIEKELAEAAVQVKNGKQLSEVLEKAGISPRLFPRCLLLAKKPVQLIRYS